MKVAIFTLFAVVTLGWMSTAQAQGRTCTVTYEKCDFAIAGNCVRWNDKSERIDVRDAGRICEDLRDRWGRIRRCDTTDCRRRRGLRWQMETRNGRVIQRFGRGGEARQRCRRELRRRQCREDRNRRARCVGLRNGRVQDSFGPLRCGR